MTAVVSEPRLRFTALGYRFDVVADDAALAARVSSACQDLASSVVDPDRITTTYRMVSEPFTTSVTLEADGEVIVREAEPWHALAMLLWHVNQQTTAHTSKTHVVLHAAAAVLDGQSVLLPAPMESGKTTTVTGLVLDGFGYLTDEAAAISLDDKHVEAFPKSLSIDKGSWQVLEQLRRFDAGGMPHQWAVPVSSIPSPSVGVASRSPIGLIVFPRYEHGAETRAEVCTPGEAAILLAQSTFHFLHSPARNLKMLATLAADVPSFHLIIGSLDEAVSIIRDAIERRHD